MDVYFLILTSKGFKCHILDIMKIVAMEIIHL
jgi:hypothetical protein